MKITKEQIDNIVDEIVKDYSPEDIVSFVEDYVEEYDRYNNNNNKQKVYTLEFYDKNIGVYSSLEKAEQAYRKVDEKGLDNLSIMSFDLDSEDFNNGKMVDENG